MSEYGHLNHCSDPKCVEVNPQPLSNFYTQKRIDKENNYWTYYNPECKACTKRRVKEKRNNPDYYRKHVEQQRVRNLLPEVKEQKKKWRDSNKGKKNRKEWTSLNKGKLKEYTYNHSLHKQHEITEEEWKICKSYFNNCCAYCGIEEERAKGEQGQYFHKEHAINNGTNDITNCVPSCRNCNSSKWKHDYTVWFDENNPVFSEERLTKINKWLNEDCLKVHK